MGGPEDTDPALVAAIVAAPDDAAPRLIYADWLEERGWEVAPRELRKDGVLEVGINVWWWPTGRGWFDATYLGRVPQGTVIRCDRCGHDRTNFRVAGQWLCSRCKSIWDWRGIAE